MKRRIAKGKSHKTLTLIVFIQTSLFVTSFALYSLNSAVPNSILLTILLLDVLFITRLIGSLLTAENISTRFNLIFFALSTIYLIFTFALLYTNTGINAGYNNVVHDLNTSFYFSVVTWTSLGYGDVSPTPDSRLWVMLEVFIGYFHMSIVLGFIIDSIKKA